MSPIGHAPSAALFYWSEVVDGQGYGADLAIEVFQGSQEGARSPTVGSPRASRSKGGWPARSSLVQNPTHLVIEELPFVATACGQSNESPEVQVGRNQAHQRIYQHRPAD